MPFKTIKGYKVWITPQRDTKIGGGLNNTVRGIEIPDYILYGKDEHSNIKWHNKEDELEFRDRQKRDFQSKIMSDEFRTLKNTQMEYVKEINKLNDSIYLLKRKSLIDRKKKQLADFYKKEKEIEEKLQDYR